MDIVVKSIFMFIILVGSFYSIYIKDSMKNADHDLSDDSAKSITKLLSFGVLNFYFLGSIFEIETFTILSMYSILILVIGLKPKQKKTLLKTGIIVIVLLAFVFYRVPKTSSSFEQYISSKEEIECKYIPQCVKITYYTDEDNLIQTKAEIVYVKDVSFDWYVLFSKGSIKISDIKNQEETIRAINIAGFWMEY